MRRRISPALTDDDGFVMLRASAVTMLLTHINGNIG